MTGLILLIPVLRRNESPKTYPKEELGTDFKVNNWDFKN